MAAQFADLPEAIENTIEIARRCAFRPDEAQAHPAGVRAGIRPRSPEEELKVQAEEGLTRRLAGNTLAAERKVYDERLAYELAHHQPHGLSRLLPDRLRLHEMDHGRSGIPVGVRGSGASSLVAWALDITNLDPLRFGLFFERFLNPERLSMPDFDIDFCQERRDEVVRYVRDKYGADRVAQIIALGSLQARAAVRDAGRVLQMPLGLVDRIAKLIPNPPGKPMSLQRRDRQRAAAAADRRSRNPSPSACSRSPSKIEGLYRHASTHPAGVVIGDRPLDEILPLYRDPRSDMPVTQFDYEDAEKAGLVKFDFLGLKTLTVIAKAEELLKKRGIALHTQTIDFDDAAHLRDAGAGRQRRRVPAGRRGHARPAAQDEARPYQRSGGAGGALSAGSDGFDSQIHRLQERQGGGGISASRCWSRSCKETYGVMTYQDDVMRIARELAGYTMGEADLLRRAMGKKIPAEMIPHREKFLKGAGERGIIPSIAEQIFEQAEKFAGYGFNKGHAAAYAQVAYQTAYLKANYPVEFLAASMTLDIGNTDRLNIFRQEAQRLGVKIAPPDINRSEAVFTCDAGADTVFYALAAVKGVGRQAMDHVVEMRAAPAASSNPFPISPAGSIPGWSTSAPLKIWCGPAPSTASTRTAASWWKIPTASWAGRRRRARARKRPGVACSAAATSAARNCA